MDIDAGAAAETAAAVAALGRESLALDTDVGDLAAIDRMVSRVMETFGRIDVLVNNAGVTRRAYIMDLTEADWDRIMRVNGKGVFFCLQRVAREMIPRRSGVIINIASIAGKGYAGTSNAIYAGEQGRGHRADAASPRCSSPATTSTSTPSAPAHGHRAVRGQPAPPAPATRASASRRWRAGGTRASRSAAPNDPEDIAALAVFLASPGARNITGQSFNVDGGLIFD